MPPRPINRSKNDSNVSSNNIIWDGPNIPCIELCSGDTVSNIVYKIAKEICRMVDDVESLKTLTFECLVDCPTSCDPKDYSIKAIFEVLLANDCKLQGMIKAIEASAASGGVVLGNLDVSCLESHMIKLCIDPEAYTLNDIFQCFIDIICDHETRIVDIINRIQALEVLIQNLQNTVVTGTYTEPSFTTCVNGTTLTHSAITPLIADFACQIRTDMGTALDVAGAISQQCLTDYTSNTDIIQNATTLADDNHNKWIIICDLLQRIKFMEDNCCAPVCDDISIGYSASYNVGTQQVTLTFSNFTNTFIPLGFVDCGSTITLTDTSNNTITLPITLSNGLVWVSPSLSLDFTNPISTKINTCFTNQINGLKCVDCFTQVIPAQDIECKLCKLCTSGGVVGDKLAVTYTTLSNPTPVTVDISFGGCLTFEIPTDTPIISSVITLTPGSSMTLSGSTDCPSMVVIPQLTGPTCWFFPIPVNNPYSSISLDGFNCAANQQLTVSLNANTNMIYDYANLITNLGPIPIAGKTQTYGTSGATSHFITTTPNANLSSVSSMIVCTASIGSAFVGELPGGNYGTQDLCQGLVGQTVSPNLTYDTGGNPFGIYVKIVGQPANVTPYLEMLDTISNQLIYSKGTLTPTCPC